MRILTLTQPWATLVAVRAKKFETRSWGTSYRGPLAIHAAKGLGPIGGVNALVDYFHRSPFYQALTAAEYQSARDLPLGAIVAVCTLAEVYEIRDNGLWANQSLHTLPSEPERSFGDYTPGRFAWRLTDVQTLAAPLPFSGAQGLRPISDPAALKAIYAQVQ